MAIATALRGDAYDNWNEERLVRALRAEGTPREEVLLGISLVMGERLFAWMHKPGREMVKAAQVPPEEALSLLWERLGERGAMFKPQSSDDAQVLRMLWAWLKVAIYNLLLDLIRESERRPVTRAEGWWEAQAAPMANPVEAGGAEVASASANAPHVARLKRALAGLSAKDAHQLEALLPWYRTEDTRLHVPRHVAEAIAREFGWKNADQVSTRWARLIAKVRKAILAETSEDSA